MQKESNGDGVAPVKCVRCNAPAVASVQGHYACTECGTVLARPIKRTQTTIR